MEVKPPLSFRPIALRVLEERYLRRDPQGHVVETPDELFHRVARGVAKAEAHYGGMEAVARRTAEAHGGRISLQSAVGVGTTVEIQLPFRRSIRLRHVS